MVQVLHMHIKMYGVGAAYAYKKWWGTGAAYVSRENERRGSFEQI